MTVGLHTTIGFLDETLKRRMQSESAGMQELARLASFKHWLSDDTMPSPLILARCGFKYSENKIICPLCKMELEHLSRDEHPGEAHRRLSPNCPLAINAVSNGMINQSTGPLENTVHIEETGTLVEVYNNAMQRSQNGVTVASHVAPRVASAIASPAPTVIRDRLNPDFDLLRSENVRLGTFYDWPAVAHAVPQELAEEGFFYTGTADRVRCAFCRNFLRSWVPGDVPREEHRKHFPDCPFVRNLDVGNVRDDRREPSPSLIALCPNSGFRADPISVESCMTTSTVRAILEMGFPMDQVEQVVQQQLNNNGVFFPDAESLLEKLFSEGVSQSLCREHHDAQVGVAEAGAAGPEPGNNDESLASEEPSLAENRVVENKQGNWSKKKKKRQRKKEKNEEAVGSQGSANGEVTPAQAATSPEPRNANEDIRSLILEEEEQLLEENSRLREARTCKVCMDKEVNTVFLPCGHLICCDVCSPQVRNCPLCRTLIRGTVKTYLS